MIPKLLLLFLIFTPLTNIAQQQSLIYEIRYKQNKYELSTQNKEILSTISNSLIEKSNYIIFINGHADSDADSSYNQQLSLKRSIAVRKFLILKGIDESFIRVRSKGEDQPLVANSSPLAKAKNRRVEIVLLFEQTPQMKIINEKNEKNTPTCNRDTTVTLEDGYILTMSVCDWKKNSQCLRVIKKLTSKFKVKENWLKKHIGLKNYTKYISYEPHYEFSVVSCFDSCFKKPIKLNIPHYNAPGFDISESFTQKKNNEKGSTALVFKNVKLNNSLYYVANIYCPGILKCNTDNSCTHLVNLYAKNNISILSYSYFNRLNNSIFDTILNAEPINSKRITDNYRNSYFHTLKILYKGDTINLKNIPIDIFAHGARKIKTKGSIYDKSYFLFIPYRKKYTCNHYKKYKIRARDIKYLKEFDIQYLNIDN